MGPDGAIYIADWYNPIIQHGEVDFRDERRDRVHGRIWRVTAKGRPLLPRTDFTKLSTAALLEQLQRPEGHAQAMARRVLFERGGREVREALRTWTAGLQPAAADFHLLQLEALRLWQGLDDGTAADVQLPLLKALLAAPDPRARAAAARVVVDWADRLEQPVELLAASVDDPEPCVRLEGVRALAALGGKRAAELVLHAVDHPRDDALDYAVWLAARELEEAWVPAVLDGSFADDGKLSRILFAVQAAETTAPIPLLVARLQAGSVSDADRWTTWPSSAALLISGWRSIWQPIRSCLQSRRLCCWRRCWKRINSAKCSRQEICQRWLSLPPVRIKPWLWPRFRQRRRGR